MPPVRFEPTIPASARPQTYALNRTATGIGILRNVRAESYLAKSLKEKMEERSNEGRHHCDV
jgi:hypothetical protein